jgi:hypothetical protein
VLSSVFIFLFSLKGRTILLKSKSSKTNSRKIMGVASHARASIFVYQVVLVCIDLKNGENTFKFEFKG